MLIELVKAALMGVLEGITEWLPISSTGHMLLLQEYVHMNTSKDFWDMFLVVIQLGAIFAVLIRYATALNPFERRKTAHEKTATWRLWGLIILACLPAALIGIPFDDVIEGVLSSPLVIAGALIFYGVVLIVLECYRKKRELAGACSEKLRQSAQPTRVTVSLPSQLRGQYVPKHLATSAAVGRAPAADFPCTVDVSNDPDTPYSNSKNNEQLLSPGLQQLSIKDALVIGAFQVLSLVPGTSRSGSTIIGGLVRGLSRTTAAEFSFFLAIPVMFGASSLRLAKFFIKGNSFSMPELQLLLVGCVTAFVVSLFALKFLTSFVKTHDFRPFGIYRIVLGIIVIIHTFLQNMPV